VTGMHKVNNDEPCTTALMLAARHHHPECVQPDRCLKASLSQFREQTRASAAIVKSERALQLGASLLGSRVWSAE
jgi:hypothetical protein